MISEPVVLISYLFVRTIEQCRRLDRGEVFIGSVQGKIKIRKGEYSWHMIMNISKKRFLH